MTITDKTRKILWARSYNLCAICKHELVADATCANDESVLGEECHIVSGQSGGPRYEPSFPTSELDEYDNLLILCRNHHKMVDDQCDTYTADILRQMKANHEVWVKQRLCNSGSKAVKIKRVKQNIPKHLARLTSGEEIVNLVANSYVLYTNHDHLERREEVDLVGQFFQTLHDYGDMVSELGPNFEVELSFETTKSLRQLEDLGFWVFGAREKQVVEGGVGGTSDWPVAYLHVLRKNRVEKPSE